jgi:hypothetical protein
VPFGLVFFPKQFFHSNCRGRRFVGLGFEFVSGFGFRIWLRPCDRRSEFTPPRLGVTRNPARRVLRWCRGDAE